LPQDEAAQLHINTISDLAPQVPGLILASTNDGIAFVDSLKSIYNFDTHSFRSLSIDVLEGISLDAVDNNHAQISVCYITDASIKARNFVFLIDDKNGFPQFHPAPIVRDNVLHKNPAIANVLNPLAPKLTTDVSIELQARVQQLRSWGTPSPDAITQVATDFLTNQGLL
jgi:osmoprotectant transport system substrate-binding protein